MEDSGNATVDFKAGLIKWVNPAFYLAALRTNPILIDNENKEIYNKLGRKHEKRAENGRKKN